MKDDLETLWSSGKLSVWRGRQRHAQWAEVHGRRQGGRNQCREEQELGAGRRDQFQLEGFENILFFSFFHSFLLPTDGFYEILPSLSYVLTLAEILTVLLAFSGIVAF